LQRPFLFSSIYPIILVPFFNYLEKSRPHWFVKRTIIKSTKSDIYDSLYHLFTFICLCLCNLVDPYTFTISLKDPPPQPPPLLVFLFQTVSLVLFFEIELSILHWLFHYNRWLYKKIHYVHHLDHDPTALSTTKLHLEETLSVFLVMYIIPVVCFAPHPYCLLSSFMIASVLATLAHTGLKGWFLSEYHRLHHQDYRYNMLTPILSYLDPFAITKFK